MAAAGGIALNAVLPAGAYAQGSDEIRVGVVGCGGRGSGAAHNVLNSARNVTIHAVADAFESQAKGLQARLKGIAKDDPKVKELNNKVYLYRKARLRRRPYSSRLLGCLR